MALIKWLQGKKAYITAIVVGVMAALQYMGITVPVWVFTVLGALGITTLRAGMSKDLPTR